MSEFGFVAIVTLGAMAVIQWMRGRRMKSHLDEIETRLRHLEIEKAMRRLDLKEARTRAAAPAPPPASAADAGTPKEGAPTAKDWREFLGRQEATPAPSETEHLAGMPEARLAEAERSTDASPPPSPLEGGAPAQEAESSPVRDREVAEAPASEPATQLSFETQVGSVWMMRVGLFLLAIAVAFFARWLSPELGPAGKTAIAYAGTWILFALGKIYERRLREFARPLMAGALALMFFVSFSSYYIEPMRCLPAAAALAWMTLQTALILWAAHRWNSQLAAGLAIFLGHVAAFVGAGEADSFSLIVIAFLSATAMIMFLTHDWEPLSLFGLAAGYLSHFAWTLADHPPTTPERALLVNVAFLTSYYALFLGSELVWLWRRSASTGGWAARPFAIPQTLGVANLIAYASLATFYFVRTEVYFDRIHWFLFALAAAQGLIGWARLALNDKDARLYPAFGIILFTAGLLSAFDALALNMLLAAEALALLIAAHSTRIWIYHFLAQAALGINFIHYWTQAGGATDTPAFVGGLLTVAVYVLKASLEELWYGGGARRDWEGGPGQGGIISAPFARGFDSFFRVIAPGLAHVHAAAGAIILTHECGRFFSTLDAPLAMTGALALWAGLALWRRGSALAVGQAFLQAGLAMLTVRLLRVVGAGGIVDGQWTAWWVGLFGAVAAFAPVLGGARRATRSTDVFLCLLSGQAALWISLGIILAFSDNGAYTDVPHLAWMFALAVVFAHQERITSEAGLRRGPLGLAGVGVPLFAGMAVLSCLAAAGIMVRAVHREFGATASMPCMVVFWSLLLIASGAWRRHLGLYLAGLLAFVAAYSNLLFDNRIRRDVFDFAPAAVWMIGAALALGLAKDHVLIRMGRAFGAGARGLAEGAVYVTYALGLFGAYLYLADKVEFPWSYAAYATLALALFAGTLPVGLRRGQIASFSALAAAHLALLFAILNRRPLEGASLIPVGVFVGVSLSCERLLRKFGPRMAVGATPDLANASRAYLVTGSTLILAYAIHASDLLGARWTTAAWSLWGGITMTLGFLWQSAIYRRTALGFLGVCLTRVFLVDVWQLSDAYRWAAFLALGVCFIAVSWLYSRHTEQIKKWL